MVDQSLLRLYKELPQDQCTELYLRQHDNMDRYTRSRVLQVLGARLVYGDAYNPDHYKEAAVCT